MCNTVHCQCTVSIPFPQVWVNHKPCRSCILLPEFRPGVNQSLDQSHAISPPSSIVAPHFDHPLHVPRPFWQTNRVVLDGFHHLRPTLTQTPVLVPYLSTSYDTGFTKHLVLGTSTDSIRTFCATTLKLSVLYVRRTNSHGFQTPGHYGTR